MNKLQIISMTMLMSLLGMAHSVNAAGSFFFKGPVGTTTTCHGNTHQINGETICDGPTTTTVKGQVIHYGGTVKQVNYFTEDGQFKSYSSTTPKKAGITKTKKITITGVNSINASTVGDMTIEQCPTCEETLTITADENILPQVKNKQSFNRLNLWVEGSTSTETPIKYHAVVKHLKALDTSGAVQASLRNIIKEDTLQVTTSGASSVKGSVDVNTLRITSDDASSVTLDGHANTQHVNASGASRYNGKMVKSHFAKIFLNGAAKVHVEAFKDLQYDCSGASHLTHSGPANVHGVLSGAAHIRKS